MFETIGGAVDRFKARADVLNREDVICVSLKKIGTVQGDDNIYLAKYCYATPMPSKVQLQACLNRDFGQTVVLDPTQVRAGLHSMVAKVYSKYGLTEVTSASKYVSGLKAAMDEDPKDFLVEVGDNVRFFNGTTMEGQVIGFNQSDFAIRVGSEVLSVPGENVMDVKAAAKFEPVDKAAYDYYIKIFPKEFARLLTNNDPSKVENKPEGKR